MFTKKRARCTGAAPTNRWSRPDPSMQVYPMPTSTPGHWRDMHAACSLTGHCATAARAGCWLFPLASPLLFTAHMMNAPPAPVCVFCVVQAHICARETSVDYNSLSIGTDRSSFPSFNIARLCARVGIGFYYLILGKDLLSEAVNQPI